jgi:hypothetical protein
MSAEIVDCSDTLTRSEAKGWSMRSKHTVQLGTLSDENSEPRHGRQAECPHLSVTGSRMNWATHIEQEAGPLWPRANILSRIN